MTMIRSIELELEDHVFDYFLKFNNKSNCIVNTKIADRKYFINSNKFFFDLIQKNIFQPFILTNEEFEYKISWIERDEKIYHYSIKVNNNSIEEEELKLIEIESNGEDEWAIFREDYDSSYPETYRLINISKDGEILFGNKWYLEELNYDEVIEKLYFDIPNKREHLLLPQLNCLSNIFKYLLEDVEIYFPGEEPLISYQKLEKDESRIMKRMLETFDLGFTKITDDWRFLFNEYEVPLEDLGSGTNYLIERLPQIIKAIFGGKTYFETNILNSGKLHPLLKEYIPTVIVSLIEYVEDRLKTKPGQIIFFQERI